MGAKLGTTSGPNSDLNLTPMIDIVLVVLIIMMVSMPVKIQELGVKLPSVQTEPPKTQNPADQLVVALYEDGEIALNRRPIAQEDLFSQVGLRLRNLEKKNVFIDAHPNVTFGQVVDLVDLIKSTGPGRMVLPDEATGTDVVVGEQPLVGLARMKPNGPRVADLPAFDGARQRGVRVGSISLQNSENGDMKEAQADQVIEARMDGIKGCYLNGLNTNPSLGGGSIVLRAMIGPSGQQLEAPVITDSSTLKDDALDECLLPVFESLQFPSLGSNNTAAVQYLLLFYPG